MALNEAGDLILSARTNPAADPKKSMCRALVDLGTGPNGGLSVNHDNDFGKVVIGGNVGIGTMNPQGALHIVPAADNPLPLIIVKTFAQASGPPEAQLRILTAKRQAMKTFLLSMPEGTLCIGGVRVNTLYFFWRSGGSVYELDMMGTQM